MRSQLVLNGKYSQLHKQGVLFDASNEYQWTGELTQGGASKGQSRKSVLDY